MTVAALQAWVDTYAAPGFEEAAAKVEALLDREYGRALASAAAAGAGRCDEGRGVFVCADCSARVCVAPLVLIILSLQRADRYTAARHKRRGGRRWRGR
jgi:hypothetical protein